MTQLPEFIRKRNGRLALFERDKISTAVKKAFFVVTGNPHDDDVREILEAVIRDIAARFELYGSDYIPAVEEVQDVVELAIMERGFFNVAKAYIIYRFEHQKEREERQEEIQEKIERSEFQVLGDRGTETLSLDTIHDAFVRASYGFENTVHIGALVDQMKTEVYEGMTARDIAHALVLVARSFIERDPAYSVVAARLLLQNIVYRDALSVSGKAATDKGFQKDYRTKFPQFVKEAIARGHLDARMSGFDLEKLARAIDPLRDDLLKYLGAQTLVDRYLIRDRLHPERRRLYETPQFMWMRVAMGLALNEDRKEERAIAFYNLISTLRYTPATPTLMNAGTTHSQLSSCYLGVVDDTLESIFKAYSDYSHLAKFDGGVGQSWTKLRGTNASVKSTNITSNGVVPFLKILDSTVVCINRSGRRRGACSVYLEPWHIDFEDFIELTKNVGDERRRTPDLHPVSWIPDLFMKRVRANGEWTLFSPDETPDLPEKYGKAFEEAYEGYERMAREGKIRLFKTIRARDLWKRMLTQLFETGHPWMTWKDPSNIRSPQDHIGVIHNSNLCTEITLNNDPDKEVAVCNLGSVNLGLHIIDGKLDATLVRETVTIAMRMLDNVIDLNFYPIPETRVSNMRHRPVGLGVMGLQDALYKLGLTFESEEAVRFADESMELISYYAILASSTLARERGYYETYKGSKWDRSLFPIDTIALLEEERGEIIAIDRTEHLDWSAVRESVKRYGMRNSNCMAIAPTATIANIAGCYPSIEPIYKNIYVKENISGKFIVVNHYLVEDLKKEGLWNDEMLELIKGHDGDICAISAIPDRIKARHKEVFVIDPHILVRLAAYRGKWIDQGQSLNIFYAGTSGSLLSDLYLYAWQLGLKTTYYLRTLGATTIEKSTVTIGNQETHSHSDKRVRDAAAEAVRAVKEELAIPKETVLVSCITPLDAPNPPVRAGLCAIDDPTCESCQ